MINTISNFNLALFDPLPNTAQGAPAVDAEKGNFASLLLGIPVASVPVNADPAAAASVIKADPAVATSMPVAPAFAEEAAKADAEPTVPNFMIPAAAATEVVPATELPLQEDLCWGVMGCETPTKDAGLEVLKTRRFIVDFEPPVKLPPQEIPVQSSGTKDIALSVLAARRVIANVEAPPVKLPPQEIPAQSGGTKDIALSVLAARRVIANVDVPPVKLPPQETPVQSSGTKDIALSVLAVRRVIANVEAPPVKLPPQMPAGQPTIDEKYPIDVLNRPRPINEAISPILAGTGPDTDTTEYLGLGLHGRSQTITNTATPNGTPSMGTPADPAWQHDNVQNTVKPAAPAVPVLPTRLPPQGSLWSDGSERDPKTNKKDFGIAMLKDRRQITDVPAQSDGVKIAMSEAVTGTPLSAKVLFPASPDVVITKVEVSPTTPAPIITGTPLNDRAPEPGAVIPEFRSPLGQNPEVAEAGTPTAVVATDSKVSAETDTRDVLKPKEKPELRPSLRPDLLPLRTEKPLGQKSFAVTEKDGSAPAKTSENLTGLRQLRREVSFAFQPGPETGTPRVGFQTVRNIAPESASQVPVNPTEFIAEGDAATAEPGIRTQDRVDVFNNVLDKFQKTDTPAVSEVKTETVADLLRQAKETLAQLEPGLLELAALTTRRNEKQSMRMRLHPAELGTVDISLERNSAGALSAHFNAGTDSAREVLTQNIDHLRESLQNAGWQVGQLQVSSGSSPFTSPNDRQDRQPQFESFNGHMSGNDSEQSVEAEQDPSRLVNLRA